MFLRKKRVFAILPVIAVLVLLTLGCQIKELEKPPDEVTVQLQWFHGAEFAGFYAADQNGYYADEGLKVDLLPRPKPGTDLIAPVIDEGVTFGMISGAGLLSARSSDKPVIAIASIYRRNPLVFMTLADSGISRPQDFPGRTMRKQGGPGGATFNSIMMRLDLDPDSVHKIDTGFDLAPFLSGEVEIWPSYLTDQVLIVQKQGYEVNLILPDDYGIHLYADTLFTTERLIREKPDLVLRFLRATLRGWRWAVENPGDAGRMVLTFDPKADEAHQIDVMNASVPLIHTGEDQVGWMRDDLWRGMHQILLEQGALNQAVDLDKVYTMEFLQQIYSEGGI